jgi:hypothetical protein
MQLSHPLNDNTATEFDFCLYTAEPGISHVNSDEDFLKNLSRIGKDTIQKFRFLFYMGTKKGFYEELIRVFSLPDYFGRNLNALNGCLTDNDILRGLAFIVVIVDGDFLLVKEGQQALSGFLDTLSFVGKEWGYTCESGEAWDRPAIPFHTIIQNSNNLDA